jgi:hypothetical protein
VPLLSFLGFREVLGDVFDIDERPGEIISFAKSFEPGGFCWEARRAMEVPNGRFDAEEFIYVVEVLLVVILAHLECYMFVGDLVCFDGVQGVEAVLSRWIIQDESVRVEVGDNGDQGDTPKIRAWATPSFEYRFRRDCDFGGFCVIEIYLIFVIDGCLARVGVLRSEFSTSEGTMLMSRASARTMWSNLLSAVAGATAPFGNIAEDARPVGMDGSSLKKALDVAPVSLTAGGIVPFSISMRILRCATSGSMRYVVRLSGGHPRRRHIVLSLSM